MRWYSVRLLVDLAVADWYISFNTPSFNTPSFNTLKFKVSVIKICYRRCEPIVLDVGHDPFKAVTET